MTENQPNTVPFEYTLRPRGDQPMYVPTIGEPYNPPAPLLYLHLQVQLPFTVNRDYGLAVDWTDDAGMRPSANKVVSLASDKTYNAGTLELDADGKLWARYLPEDSETLYDVELTGGPTEHIKAALTKLFTGEYQAEAVQLEDEDEEPEDNEAPSGNKWGEFDDSDDKEDDEDEYED